MANLTQAVQDLTDSEVAMEARIVAKIAEMQSVSDGLQAQIDALNVGNGDLVAVEAALVALKAKVDAFVG